ncbi:hypothetical protein SAMN02745671_02222 [Anaerovibrio lipolyticus DSM 3074]|uniref:Uncharacterized protein n=1 Tax=Anaerovibrio lipolyticus DSM 3074 TaxID=1120997 RepID=A0A1M6FDA2_9FIRM|nr:hypothetical protein [Anaerovibrio lipolyticus]SHI95616.1 hypothetical protein SAMN02745671_02222 [Anaerovibrio lipolyticus DSM 3074]
MQFRSDYFTTTFYNCGGAVGGNYDEYLNFLKNLDYTPKCIILGLDAWVFNHEWNYNCRVYDELVPVTEIPRPKMTLVKAVITDWLDNKWSFSDIDMYPQNIGFNGRIKDQGFMIDGSYYNGYIYRNPQASSDYMFKDTYKRIETGTARFEWGANVDLKTLTKLDALLAYCAEKGIYVIGFSPPFAPSVISAMYDSGKYLYLPEIAIQCTPLFKKYGFEFYDYLDISGIGASDDNFLDGFHGSCVAYAYIVNDMIKCKSKIVKYVDNEKLDLLVKNAYNGRTFYDPEDKR